MIDKALWNKAERVEKVYARISRVGRFFSFVDICNNLFSCPWAMMLNHVPRNNNLAKKPWVYCN